MAKVFRVFSIDKNDIFVALFGVVFLLATIPVVTYFYFSNDLHSKESIMNRNDTGVILLDKNDQPFYTLYQAKTKTFVPIDSIPTFTQQAIIAAEDKQFYSHMGFSLRAIIAALIADIKRGNLSYGGSTITQQLVKNSLLSSQRSFLRKTQEIILAQEIERRFSKKEILEMYLNSVYFGEGAFGIEEAAKIYFEKHAKDLNLSESTLLAGLLPSPSQLSPRIGNIQGAKARQRYVLSNMLEERYITQEEKERAEEEKLIFNTNGKKINTTAIHFALYVKNQLIKTYGEERISRSGFKVHTTLDMDWQKYAEKVVSEHVEQLKSNNASNGSAVAINVSTGEIRAWVGSKDWYNDTFGKVNMVTAPRSPGSSFKPIVYAAAFEKRIITPATTLRDEPTTFTGNYKPFNYDRKYRGPVSVRRALANSLNIPSVEIISHLGITDTIDMAKELGITTINDPSHYGLSLVLGAGEVSLLEMTNVYATFAREGVWQETVAIRSIEDKFNQIIYQKRPRSRQAIGKSESFLISSILSDNNARAEVFGNVLTLSKPAAVKTGTSEDFRDALTLGYTPSLAIGVWVGNSDNKPMDNIAGSLGAAPIWRQLMEKFLENNPIETFTPPAEIIAVPLCGTSTATPSGKIEYFVKGTQPATCVAPKPSPVIGNNPPLPPTSPTPIPTQGNTKKKNDDEEKREKIINKLQSDILGNI